MVDRITDLNTIEFPKLGITFHINPTAFSIGNLTIQWYGLLIGLGLVLACLYCMPKMKRFGIDPDRAVDAVIGGLLGGIVGARLYYVIFNWSEYKDDIKSVFYIRQGGLAIYGGILGAVLVGLIVCKIRKVKMLPMLDISCLGFLIGQGIGRWGNFVNQEAFGTRTDSFLGMTGGRIQEYIIENSTRLGGALTPDSTGQLVENLELYPVHPCFLYESLWCILGFFILSAFSKRRKFDGQILLMYMSWYGFERFFVEGLRTDSLMLGSLRVSQALSALLFATSVIIHIVMLSKIKRDPKAFVLYSQTKESRLLLEEGRRRRMGIPPEDISIDDDIEDDDNLSGSDILDDDEEDDTVEENAPEKDKPAEENAPEEDKPAEENAPEKVKPAEKKSSHKNKKAD